MLSCSTCRCWHSTEPAQRGNAPRAHLGGGDTYVVIQAMWPETVATGWCGQHSEISTELQSKPPIRETLRPPGPVITKRDLAAQRPSHALACTSWSGAEGTQAAVSAF